MNKREISISAFHQAILNKEMCAVDLVSYYIERIQRLDPKLHAIICINESALSDAEALDLYYRDNGFKGPLHGVPVLVKDNIETMGIETTAGSLSLRGFTPAEDADIIKRIKAAGGIVIAKANLHEFAIWGETISSVLGQTLNPYDFTRTPGGSSGGTGAGIAADFALVGLGTDTINSVRSPASANNLVGIRPTLGLVSRSGIVPYSYTQDTAGPLARHLEDAVICLEAMMGYDPLDTITAWGYPYAHIHLRDALKPSGLKGKRIGVLACLMGNGTEHLETNSAVEAALNCMKNEGAEIVTLNEHMDTGILVSEVSVHLHDFKDHLNTYLSTLPVDMPYRTMAAIVESGLYHPGIKDNLSTALTLTTEDDQYRKRQMKRLALQDQVMKLFADHALDAVVYPHQKQLVCEIGGSQSERNGVIASVTGFPSICMPAGFSKPSETAVLGVPIGLEILGRPFSEPLLIEIAYGYECHAELRKSPDQFE